MTAPESTQINPYSLKKDNQRFWLKKCCFTSRSVLIIDLKVYGDTGLKTKPFITQFLTTADCKYTLDA